LITLKVTNSSGSDIAFDATIDSDKKIITINPDSDFSSEQVIYVAIGTTVEDDANNAISASSATFTAREIGVADTTAPTITFNPANSATGVAKDSNITLTFSEAIRNNDNTVITDSNVGSLITLKATNSSGANIGFAASINTAKTVITINPTSDFSSEQAIYVAIGSTVEDLYDNPLTASSATFTAIDTISPTLTFDPVDLENPVPVSDNITITFNEAVRNTNDSALTSSNVDGLITLKDSDENGTDIDFNATIDSDKKIITINPDSNFSSEQTVYVAIGATLEDDSDNAISAGEITFVAADSTAPNLDFTPANSDTGIAINSDITIAFDEVIRNTDDSALTDSNVDSLITLKTNNSSGADIAFDAVIDNSKQLITIAPNSDFSSEQVVYVAIGATVEDASDNAISASSITFTAADATAPTVAFVPPDASNCVPISSNVSLTFSEAVRNTDDSAITDSNVGSLITLEYTSDNSPVAFTATIDSDKKVITINPDSDFVSGQVVNVAIEAVEDSSDNVMSATSGTFCVVDSTAPVLTFSPADSSTMVAEDTDVTLSFDEEIRLIDNSALNNTNVDSLITLKENDINGDDIPFDATIDADKQVITLDLVGNLSSNQIVYVAIGATVEDSYNNAISAASATFTTGDSLPPTVEIAAVITASIATDSDITFTFSEKIRLINDSAIDNTNVGSLITLKDTDANGTDIPFSATINSAKTIITINPTSNFLSQQIVYAEVPANTFEDFSDNLVPQTIKTFTAEYLKTELSDPLGREGCCWTYRGSDRERQEDD
jgi:methionine-rich copper-binding protein CopC